ncbi:MAG TPA: threonine synthase, partial [Terriglobales bacterium]|nr:threonine synthase [Terriglobales bacterium]
VECVREWAAEEGVFAAPEGAASLAAYKKLLARKFLKPSDTVVLFNTGSGLKYIDVIAPALKAEAGAADQSARHIGGIIGPY